MTPRPAATTTAAAEARGGCDLSVLVVSYNTRELLLACIGSVFEHAGVLSLEVIVVDNGSSDGSAEAIAGRFPAVDLLALDDNLGFAAANNLAASHARGEVLLLLNPDTVVLGSALEDTLRFLRSREDAGAVGVRTLYEDGTLNPTCCWGRSTLWSLFCTGTGLSAVFPRSSLFNPEGLGGWSREDLREVGTITGCFLMIRRALWNELGGFDPRFFMYGEDVDLSLRVRRAGYKCLHFPGAEIIHHGGRSDHVHSEKMIKVLHAKGQVLRKHWRPLPARLGMALLALGVVGRMAAHGARDALRGRRSDSGRSWRAVWRARDRWLRPPSAGPLPG